MDVKGEESVLSRLDTIRERAVEFFADGPVDREDFDIHYGNDDYLSLLSPPQQALATALRAELAALGHHAGRAIRQSPLLSGADESEAGQAIKGMRAALRFRSYAYHDTRVLHDEDRALGVQAAYDEETRTSPRFAAQRFDRWYMSLRERLELVDSTASQRTLGDGDQSRPAVRPGTAFIMMSMGPDPFLVDVSNTIKECFHRFRIRAQRADDIEHEGVITQKILDEIKSAEFLVADLSEERPSVYYEVGFAHAVERRVTMFRKKGTKIHFDLAAYNCPEYENISSLRDKLMKRLENITGEKPSHI